MTKADGTGHHHRPLHRLIYRLHEKLYQSGFVRSVIAFLLRVIHPSDRKALVAVARTWERTPLLVINAYQIYEFKHIRPLYLKLASNPSIKVLLIGSNPFKMKRAPYKAFMKENDLTDLKDIFSYIWLPLLKADIFFSTSITQYHRLCPGTTTKVLFAHGLSSLGFSKNSEHVVKAVDYDYILSTGPLQQKALTLAAQRYQVDLPRIVPGGFIRGDMLTAMSDKYDRAAFYAKCGLLPRPTVIFAPTWGEFSATVDWLDPIVTLSREMEFNLLIKLHPLMLGGQTDWETAGIDWPQKLALLARHDNVHICDKLELEDYMLGSDALITDVSSVGLEYMFLRRPVIFLPAPEFFDIYGREKPIHWVREGLEIQDINELAGKLKNIFGQDQTRIDYDTRDMCYNPGNALESITSWVIDTAVRKNRQ